MGRDYGERNRYLFLSFGKTTCIMNTDSGSSDLSLGNGQDNLDKKNCMLLELPSGRVTTANLLDLAMLQSVRNVLMRTVQSVECVDLETQFGKHLSIQTKSENENQGAKLLATQKERVHEWHMHMASTFKAMHASEEKKSHRL